MGSMKDSSFGKKIGKADSIDSKPAVTTNLTSTGPTSSTTTSTMTKPAVNASSTTSTTSSTSKNTGATAKKAASRSDIEKRAYEIWKRQGCQAGRDMENWVQAEKELGLK